MSMINDTLLIIYQNKMFDVHRPSCVVRCQQLLFRTSPPKLQAEFSSNLDGMTLIWSSLIIVQMVMVRCISRSHRLEIDFRDKNMSETTRPRALIFGM